MTNTNKQKRLNIENYVKKQEIQRCKISNNHDNAFK